ncbi:unnamed protein product, partial [Haemonchus placei]|uniref:Saposin B-type domain-containing protein n=1 Tax=Haemonchus placei TaxID=6290 RepID=A0A0N4W7D6_HAEPC
GTFLSITVFHTSKCSVLFQAAPNSTLTPEETCALCQTALRTVFGHFGANIPSRRKLVHQLKHECKRHFNYRRRCLLLMKQHYNMVFLEMTDGSFTPMQACLNMKVSKQ